MRVLAGVDAMQVERALLLWQDQVLGPAEDPLIAVDGKNSAAPSTSSPQRPQPHGTIRKNQP